MNIDWQWTRGEFKLYTITVQRWTGLDHTRRLVLTALHAVTDDAAESRLDKSFSRKRPLFAHFVNKTLFQDAKLETKRIFIAHRRFD